MELENRKCFFKMIWFLVPCRKHKITKSWQTSIIKLTAKVWHGDVYNLSIWKVGAGELHALGPKLHREIISWEREEEGEGERGRGEGSREMRKAGEGREREKQQQQSVPHCLCPVWWFTPLTPGSGNRRISMSLKDSWNTWDPVSKKI